MARVKKIENNLVKPYIKHRNRAITLFVIGGVLIVSSFLMDPLIILTLGLLAPLSMLLFVAGGVCLLFGALNFNKAEIYNRVWLRGYFWECIIRLTWWLLSISIHRYRVWRQKSQIDHLVGTYRSLYQNQNINGDIVGSDDDNHITIHKIGQKRWRVSKYIYNPIKQVSTHVYRTSGYLREQGIDVWVQGMGILQILLLQYILNQREYLYSQRMKMGE